MNSRVLQRQGGFTAIELLVVIGIMMLLLSIAVPTVMPAIRRGKIHSSLNDISTCWRQARQLALTTSVPARGGAPRYFGIMIQPGPPASVSLIFDNVDSGTPRLFVRGQDPSDDTTYNPGLKPAAQFVFSRTVMVVTGPDAITPPTVPAAPIILYSQYGTGFPILPADVAANRGMVAAPCSLGIAGIRAADGAVPPPTSTSPASVCPLLRVQTLDYQDAPARRGFASNFAIYHPGFTANQEF